ncbi:MAG: DNA primase [Desulfuromonas sp.]|nr:DNA primase [Desulfuromonas sp.]
MNGRIADDLIMQIRERVDIVELISSYVQLKRSGANHLGLCPFHHEKTPSFSVNSAKQIFHCFGCGVGGNVFSFLMRIEGLAFPQAVRRLAEQVGIEIPQDEPDAFELQRRKEREQLLHIYNVATEFYHQLLVNDPRAAQARGYIRRRGFTSDIVRRFRLGYAPDGWNNLCEHFQHKGIDAEQAKQLGLIRTGSENRPDYDMFRQRLLFPIDDTSGNIVAFGGRVLDDSLPKYMNSPESPLYYKSSILYGLSQAKNDMRRQRKVIVVEGYFDHLALVQAGIENVVATCGTALTVEHARVLKRYVDQVVLLFDQDQAGQKACFRAMPELLQVGLQLQTLSLPAGDDPDSCVQREGAEKFAQRLEQAQSALEFYMLSLLHSSAGNAEQQAQDITEIVRMISHVPNEIERDLHLGALARHSGVERELLNRQLSRQQPLSATPQKNLGHNATKTAPVVEPPEQQPDYEANFVGQKAQRKHPAAPREAALPKAQRWLLSLMLIDEQVSQLALETGLAELFDNQDCYSLAEKIHQAWQQQSKPDETLLDCCHSTTQQTLLTDILIRGAELPDENIDEIFGDCRLAVKQGRLKQRRTELHALMREAEQQNNSDRQIACLQELTQINRQLKNRNN